jgi:hypothetical protein
LTRKKNYKEKRKKNTMMQKQLSSSSMLSLGKKKPRKVAFLKKIKKKS